jgi:hypothetical protein
MSTKISGWFSSPCTFIVYNLVAAVQNLYFLLTVVIHLQDLAVPMATSFLPQHQWPAVLPQCQRPAVPTSILLPQDKWPAVLPQHHGLAVPTSILLP